MADRCLWYSMEACASSRLLADNDDSNQLINDNLGGAAGELPAET